MVHIISLSTIYLFKDKQQQHQQQTETTNKKHRTNSTVTARTNKYGNIKYKFFFYKSF